MSAYKEVTEMRHSPRSWAAEPMPDPWITLWLLDQFFLAETVQNIKKDEWIYVEDLEKPGNLQIGN